METQQHRLSLIRQYHTYSSIIERAGLEYEPVADDELEQYEVRDLNRLVREVRDIARTPRE